MGLDLTGRDGQHYWRGFPPDLDLLLEGDVEDEPPVPMPRAEAYGLPTGTVIPREYDDPRLAAFAEAERLYFEQPTAGKMPAFKFRTNDGWWVTPAEIHKSLAAVDQLTAEEQAQLTRTWPQQIERFWVFVAWLRDVAELGGFEVS